MTRQQIISSGVLTISVAAELACITDAAIRELLANGASIPEAFTVPPKNKEWRIPANALVRYLRIKKMPVSKELLEASNNFEARNVIE
jgi:hypothetical protein